MKLSSLLTISMGLYVTVWIALLVGILLIRMENKFAKRARTWLVNRRIQQFQLPPFKYLLKMWVAKRFLLTSASFIFLIITPAVFLFFVLGVLFITPILSVYQGLVVGFLIARYDRRQLIWALGVGLFEFGCWVLAGALGMLVTGDVVFNNLTFTQSILKAGATLASGYWMPIVLCMLVNALAEVAGPIYWRMSGPVNLEVLLKGEPISADT